jgi:NAD(P)-dependent dehydrogenase (short-subunit alcohol dehydrogenase family)
MLDRNGFRVFAGVRKKADGDALRSAASQSLTPVHIDVTDAASIQAMAEKVTGEVGDAGLHGSVNNAGTTLPCPIEYLPLDGFRRQLEVNLVGPLAVTQALLPVLRRGGSRRQRDVGGRSGRRGVDGPICICQTRTGGPVRRHATRVPPVGIQVAVIEPGFVGTAMGGKLQRDTEAAIGSLPDEGRRRYGPVLAKLAEQISQHAATGSPPEVVAKAVLHALTSKRPLTRYPSGAGAKRLLFMRRILPDRQFDRIILRAGGLDGS